jgi:hypothetical protein
MLNYLEKFLNIKKANALIQALEADTIMMNGGGGGACAYVCPDACITVYKVRV